MQRANERQKTNSNAQEKKEVSGFIFFGQDGRIYEADGVTPPVCLSVACDPATWDLPHVYPKKRKKRKKGFDREITRVTGFKPTHR